MSDYEPASFPDVVISGALAMALVDVVEYARLRTHDAEDTARAELDAMSRALEYEMRDAAPPMRWVLPGGLDVLPHAFASRDEVRSLPVVLRDAAPAPPQRWIVGVPPEDAPEGVAVLDEPPPASGTVESFEITSHADPSHAWLVRDLAGTIRRTRRLDGRPYLR